MGGGEEEGSVSIALTLCVNFSPPQYVVDSLQSVLEVAESPVLLEVLVKNISLVAKLCPQHLAHHFKVSPLLLETLFTCVYDKFLPLLKYGHPCNLATSNLCRVYATSIPPLSLTLPVLCRTQWICWWAGTSTFSKTSPS